jgi:hypothetical protein
MHRHGIDKSRNDYRVVKVGIHLTTFRERPGHNGSRGCGKGKLKRPKGQVLDVDEKEIGRSNKVITKIITISKGITYVV